MSEQLRWRNPPSSFEQSGDVLVVRAAPKTDFWSRTFYGFERRNGHVYGRAVAGDFSLTVTFAADYKALYDQAGAMIRVDDDTWLKAGVELTDGALFVSAVVTRDAWSDWSITPVAGPADAPVTIRVTRHAEAIQVHVLEGETWRLVRLAFLPMGETIEAGAMCCSPTGEGLDVTFSRLEFGPPISRVLHAEP